MLRNIVGIAVAGALSMAVMAEPSEPALAEPPPGAEERSCRPFGFLAVAAFDVAERGVPMEAAVVAATTRVSEPHIGRMVRGAVRIGYEAQNRDAARVLAVMDCIQGILGR